MFKKELFTKILMIFGFATLLTATIDLITSLIPFNIENPQWAYAITQDLSDRCIVPALGILSIVASLYMKKENSSVLSKITEKTVAVYSGLFALILIVATVVFMLANNTVELNTISRIENEGKKIKTEITMLAEQKNDIKQSEIYATMQKIDKKMTQQVNNARADFLKNKVKTLLNLIAFIFVYAFTAVKLFNSRKYSNNTLNLGSHNNQILFG